MSVYLTTISDLRSRLLRGIGAMTVGPIVTAIVQLATVPLLVHAWGPAKYGNWLVLSAIPSYLSLSDLGFGDASGSDMTMKVAAGDLTGAIETFQSSWALLTLLSGAILGLVCSLVWLVPWQRSLHLAGMAPGQIEQVLCVLAAYTIVSQQSGVFESGFRCDGHFALGTLLVNLMRLGEAVVGTAVGVLSGDLLFTAIAYLVVRSTTVLAYGVILHIKTPWLLFGFGQARRATVKRLLAPAFGFVALPAGYAVSLQGFTIAIGALLGPVAVTSFATLRTLSRVGFQILGIFTNALWPELSKAFGTGDLALARRLHRRLYQAGLILSIGMAVSLWITGPFIYRFWLGSTVAFDTSCFHLLLVVLVANSLWYTSAVVPMSQNAHNRIAATFLLVSAASLALACVLLPQHGLDGAAAALLLIDGCMLWVVLKTSVRLVGDRMPGFLFSLFTTFPLESVLINAVRRSRRASA